MCYWASVVRIRNAISKTHHENAIFGEMLLNPFPLCFVAELEHERTILYPTCNVMQRDLIYIEDVVECLVRIGGAPPRTDTGWDGAAPDPAASSSAPYRLYNIGNGVSVPLPRLIECLESLLGRKAVLEMREMPPGDVPSTCADTAGLRRDFGFAPRTPMEEGLTKVTAWVLWYR